jgi:hypothetical protein
VTDKTVGGGEIETLEAAGGCLMVEKACGNCAHAMECDDEAQVFCIANPPAPVVVNNNIMSAFPMLYRWAKCDTWVEGKPQSKGVLN